MVKRAKTCLNEKDEKFNQILVEIGNVHIICIED